MFLCFSVLFEPNSEVLTCWTRRLYRISASFLEDYPTNLTQLLIYPLLISLLYHSCMCHHDVGFIHAIVQTGQLTTNYHVGKPSHVTQNYRLLV